MLQRFILRNSERFLSRWIILLLDLILVLFAFQTSVFLRFNFVVQDIPNGMLLNKLPLVFSAYAIGFLLAKSHVGVIRHTGIMDAYAVFKAGLYAVSILFGISILSYSFGEYRLLFSIPNSIVLIHFLLSIFLLIGSRFAIKVAYHKFNSTKSKSTKILIFGAGASGIITKNTLHHDTSREYEVVGFVDDNPSKVGKKIEGIPIYSRAKVFTQEFLDRNKVDQVIISIQSRLSKQRRSSVVDACLRFNLQVKIVPPVEQWIQGELSAKQIKAVKIEDLLEREPIILDSQNIKRELKDKVVLVTGAAGSIGSEIARQILHYSPKKVILLDQAESPLYELEFELKNNYPKLYSIVECVIADVRDKCRMERLMKVYKAHVVFHAAAYKHVPLMEDNPYEAVGVNILGTKVVADLSVKNGVEKFVMVSTDKAVNPTNVMGATKRIAEIYTQTFGASKNSKTQFITTRFGNVLGSNGSVIPLFRKQIMNGGPITITHKDITRFFMTIPEACNLVLEAGAMGNGGEIFVFDMGESVKIYDLAKKMIKLSGFTLDKDIEIKEVGLRPGEKLYEELLANKENTLSTHHPKIMIAQTETYKALEIFFALDQIESSHKSGDNMELVRAIKNVVPEFISNNSEFSRLDYKQVAND